MKEFLTLLSSLMLAGCAGAPPVNPMKAESYVAEFDYTAEVNLCAYILSLDSICMLEKGLFDRLIVGIEQLDNLCFRHVTV